MFCKQLTIDNPHTRHFVTGKIDSHKPIELTLHKITSKLFSCGVSRRGLQLMAATFEWTVDSWYTAVCFYSVQLNTTFDAFPNLLDKNKSVGTDVRDLQTAASYCSVCCSAVELSPYSSSSRSSSSSRVGCTLYRHHSAAAEAAAAAAELSVQQRLRKHHVAAAAAA